MAIQSGRRGGEIREVEDEGLKMLRVMRADEEMTGKCTPRINEDWRNPGVEDKQRRRWWGFA